MIKNKKASIFIYILILVSIALVLWLVVFNNSITLTNNLNIWKNSEEVFNNLTKKASIAIDTVRKYNSDWWGFSDIVSCPTNVTMSGSTASWTNISTSMVDNYGSIYCSWDYNGQEFRIYFTDDKTAFKSAFYKWDLVDLQYDTASSTTIEWTTDIISSTTLWGTNPYNSTYTYDKAKDTNLNTRYVSTKWWYYPYLDITLSSPQNVYKLNINKKIRNYWYYTDNFYVYFYDLLWNEIKHINISWVKNKTDINVILWNIWKTIKSKKIRIYWYYNRYLSIEELYLYKWENITSSPKWIWVRNFNDTDSTLISFTDDWTLGSDLVDDDLNSDDYTVGSIRRADWTIVYYADWFADDDVVPRKIIFGNVPAYTDLYNIFWNNYKTTDFIDKNINNDDIINQKIGLVSSWALYLDLYTIWKYNYNLKILEFNRNDYKDKYTLLPIATSEWRDLTDFVWYIQKSSTWVLSLSRYKTGNEYEFDFATKDYWIYISNKDSKNLSYRISWEELTWDINTTWSWIYINPINDSWINASWTWTISVMSNHMIIGWEKNFIWENFVVTEPK